MKGFMAIQAFNTSDIQRYFTEYSAGLCLYARQWLPGNAEDVVQEAFVKLISQKKLPDNVKAWLYRTVRNDCISRLRKQNVRDRAAQDMMANGSYWFKPDIDNRLDVENVQNALKKLDTDLREAVTLRLWGQLGFEEMSQITGIATSTLHNRYNRAIKALKDILE